MNEIPLNKITKELEENYGWTDTKDLNVMQIELIEDVEKIVRSRVEALFSQPKLFVADFKGVCLGGQALIRAEDLQDDTELAKIKIEQEGLDPTGLDVKEIYMDINDVLILDDGDY